MSVGPQSSIHPDAGGWLDDALLGFGSYYLTSLVVLAGLLFGNDFVKPRSAEIALQSTDLISSCVRFDANSYAEIVQNGYAYDPQGRSRVAFFPMFPVAGYAACTLFGCGPGAGLLIVSNAALVMAFVLMARLVRLQAGASVARLSVAAFGLWPTTFFFRMPYSESSLLCGLLVTLYGCDRRWHPALVAACAGLASGTRPVGVAATAAAVWYAAAWPGSIRVRAARVVLLAPLACWGLLAYMIYLHFAFGDALAFAHTQDYWTYRLPPRGSKTLSLLTLEPIRGVYDSSSTRYWFRPGNGTFLFNLQFWNPILFAAAGVAIAWGVWRRWLTGPAAVLGASLLVIPYFTRAYEMSMASHGRFAAAVVVAYPVLGRLLAAAPAAMSSILLSLCAVFLACWTALYTANYAFF